MSQMAEAVSEEEVSSTSEDFLRIRYNDCQVTYTCTLIETNSVLAIKTRD